jgi:hypothetical protein
MNFSLFDYSFKDDESERAIERLNGAKAERRGRLKSKH